MRSFKDCVDQVGSGNESSLSLDVATCWNSTHQMLDNALKYRYAFVGLEVMNSNYKYCPSSQEWSRAEKIRDFLNPFEEMTTLISRSYYPISNLYFINVWKIELLLKEYGHSEDERIQVKFDKYWDEYSIIFVIGVVLEPRMKLKGLKYCYDQNDKNTSHTNTDKVKRLMYSLFEKYKTSFVVSNSRSSTPSNTTSSKEKYQSSTLFEDLYGCDDGDLSDDESWSALVDICLILR